jgi:hypothetical protein
LDRLPNDLRIAETREVHLPGKGFALRKRARSARPAGRKNRVACFAGTRKVGIRSAAGAWQREGQLNPRFKSVRVGERLGKPDCVPAVTGELLARLVPEDPVS